MMSLALNNWAQPSCLCSALIINILLLHVYLQGYTTYVYRPGFILRTKTHAYNILKRVLDEDLVSDIKRLTLLADKKVIDIDLGRRCNQKIILGTT